VQCCFTQAYIIHAVAKASIEAEFTDDQIEKTDHQFQDLRIVFREQHGLKESLEEAKSQTTASSFQNCWRPLGSKFTELRQYVAGIITVMPGTSSVETEFSLINWTHDPNSRSLTDCSQEAILHCKQYGKLEKLFTENMP
jgi:hypothetical protein